MKNRNPVKQWFITFPQVGDVTTKATFGKRLPPAEYTFCCEEEHKEGGLHLHLIIKLKKGISHSNLVKWIGAKFPEDWKRIHFEPVRNLENAKAYCNKEDPSPHEEGEIVKRRTRYTEGDAIRDNMTDLMIRCEIDGMRKDYNRSEENWKHKEYLKELLYKTEEQEYLKSLGY